MSDTIFHEDDEYVVLIDLDQCTILLEMKFRGENIKRLDDRFTSWSHLSECLRDYSDLTFAVAALTASNIPHEHPLWTLGFKGGQTFWQRH